MEDVKIAARLSFLLEPHCHKKQPEGGFKNGGSRDDESVWRVRV